MKCEITHEILNPGQRAQHIYSNMIAEGMTPSAVIHCIEAYKTQVRQKQAGASGDGSAKLEKIIMFLSGIRHRMETGQPLEDPGSCYCGLPLSKVPAEKRGSVISEHLKLKSYIESAGHITYDPAEAPFNPQGELVGSPQDIFDVDNLMVLASGLFEFTNIEASTGAGIEQRTAMIYNKFPLIFVKKGEYVTRMSTGARRIILLEYGNVDEIGSRVTGFVSTLKEFTPGIGLCKKHGNALTGYNISQGDRPICMHGLSEELLPEMQYDFNAFKK